MDGARMSWDEWEKEFQLPIRAMEAAMSSLDLKGLFGWHGAIGYRGQRCSHASRFW